MRILAISHEFPPIGGGGANACYFLTKIFAEKGHEVTLITANFNELPNKEYINGVEIFRVESKRENREHCSFAEMFSFVKKSIPVAIRETKLKKYDVCVVFFGIPSGPIGYILKMVRKIPYIIRFGGGDVPGFQDRFTKVYKLIGPAIKAIWRKSDALIANSQGLKDMALGYYSKREFVVVPNGVDTAIFKPVPKRDSEAIEILFVSRLIERKGLQYIIPMLAEIEKISGRKIQLTVVGDGPYKDTLLNLAKENGVEAMISFEGQKLRDEVIPYYQRADIFILPSAKEGMPNVVLEAMACGLPIIMTKCQGSAELVKCNGYAVEVKEFGNKLVELISDDELRKGMGKESLRLVNEMFSWNNTAEKYIDIMEKVKK